MDGAVQQHGVGKGHGGAGDAVAPCLYHAEGVEMGGEMGVGDVADFVLAVGLDKVVLDVFQRVLRRVDMGGKGFDLVGLHLPVF